MVTINWYVELANCLTDLEIVLYVSQKISVSCYVSTNNQIVLLS